MIGAGYLNRFVSEEEVREWTGQAMDDYHLKDKRILTIIPDATRTCPLPMLFKIFSELLGASNKKLDFLIALGTHPPLSQEAIFKLVGITPSEYSQKYSQHQFFNHRWDDSENFRLIGRIYAHELEKLTEGLFKQDVNIRINHQVYLYDQVIVLGPTFPHEVVGFSGGNKYFFPGVGEAEFLNFFHWLGAVITNYNVIGTKYNPVRKVVDRAAQFITVPKLCFDMVVYQKKLAGLFIGQPEEAWSAGADLSNQLHIIYKARSFKKVLGVAPEMYDEMWVAGKVMYKLEPVIEEGGELIIYGPHIKKISITHGMHIERIGYHVRDYFLKQMDRFKDIPLGVLAHSTHVRGRGKFENGREVPRIRVTLATGLSEELCKKVNLGYTDYKQVKFENFQNKEEEGTLFVPSAGEILYRIKAG